MDFAYKTKDSLGGLHEGTLTTDSREEAVQALQPIADKTLQILDNANIQRCTAETTTPDRLMLTSHYARWTDGEPNENTGPFSLFCKC